MVTHTVAIDLSMSFTEVTVCTSDVQYEIFHVLPITVTAHQIYYDMIIIMIRHLSRV